MTDSPQPKECPTLEVFKNCGHPRTPENVKPAKGGKSTCCRTCAKDYYRKNQRVKGFKVNLRDFFSPDTNAGVLRQNVLDLYIREHRDKSLLPTNGRFLFYELIALGLVSKENKRAATDVSVALTDLREQKYIPWEDITDETREVIENYHPPTIQGSVESTIKYARISLWHPEPPPLVLCESRSIRSAIDDLCSEFQVPLAATNGQCQGFLRTKVKEVIVPGQVVLYLGDFDFSGGHIEANSREVLEEVTNSKLQWERVAITDEQIEEHGLTRIMKLDKRTGKEHEAVETEALGQARLVDLLRARLEVTMPESSRKRVHDRESRERKRLLKLLTGLQGERR